MKKTISMLLFTAMLAGLATGCSSQPQGSTSTSGSQSQSQSTSTSSGSQSKEKEDLPASVDLRVYRPIFSDNSPEGTLVEKKWLEMQEAYIGTKLNITWDNLPLKDYSTKQSIYLASGDWADIFVINGEDQQMEELATTKMLLSLDDYPDSTPYYNGLLETDDQRKRVTLPDGKKYFFADVYKASHQGKQLCFSVRFDIFQKNNLKIPESLEDFYNVAKELKALYPDAHPITDNGGGIISTVLTLNKTSHTVFYDGSKYQYGPLMAECKDSIAYLQKLYTEGLLDPEYQTQNNEAMFEKMVNSKGYMTPGIYTIRLSDQVNSTGKVEFGAIPYPKNLKNESSWHTAEVRKGTNFDPFYKIVVNAKTKHPDLAMKIIDYQYSDEMITLANWGVEGTTYNIIDGKKQLTDEVKSAESMLAKLGEFGVNSSMSTRSGIQFMPQDRDLYFETFKKIPVYAEGNYFSETSWKFYSDVVGKGSDPVPLAPAMSLTSEESAKKSQILTAVDTFVNENIAKFIVGEKKMEEWDAFVQEITKYGNYQEIVDLYNQKIGAK